MNESRAHSDALRRRVILILFLGLLFMAGMAVVIDWACQRAGGRGTFNLGWLSQIFGPALTIGGLALVVWSIRIQYSLGKGTPAPVVATQWLVTQGPYARTRNPMTLGALFMYLQFKSVMTILLQQRTPRV